MQRGERAAVERRQLFGVKLDRETVRLRGFDHARALLGQKPMASQKASTAVASGAAAGIISPTTRSGYRRRCRP